MIPRLKHLSLLREASIVVASAVFLAVVMTWPIASKMNRAARVDVTDGMYSMWNVAWVARAVTSQPWELFNANIFHPHKGTLAYSEANIGAGILGAPAWALTKNVYTTYNSVVLTGFVLSFLSTYALVRRLTQRRLPAFAAAVAFAYMPFTYARLPHIQLQMTFVIPLCLLAFHRLVNFPSWRSGTALGSALAVAGLTSAYYGVSVGLAIGVGVIFYGLRMSLWRDRAYWPAVLTALVTAAAIVAPFFAPYLELREQGFERTLDEARRYGVNGWGWLASPVRSHGWLLNENFRGVAFPGLTRLLLGGAGLTLMALRPRYAARIANGRDHALWYLFIAVLAFWTALGPDSGLYSALYYALPQIFSFLRAVERFAALVSLALCVGLGFAVVLLQDWWARSGREKRSGKVAAAALIGLIVADSWVAPLFYPDALPVPRVYRALARAPRGAVAEFPFFFRSVDLNRHAWYMLYSTYHWQPIINGYSDHYPKPFLDMLHVIKDFPTDPRSFVHLRDRDVRYVVLHRHWYERERMAEIDAGLAHYVAEGVLRLVVTDKNIEAGPAGTDYDVAFYEIVRYPD